MMFGYRMTETVPLSNGETVLRMARLRGRRGRARHISRKYLARQTRAAMGSANQAHRWDV